MYGCLYMCVYRDIDWGRHNYMVIDMIAPIAKPILLTPIHSQMYSRWKDGWTGGEILRDACQRAMR